MRALPNTLKTSMVEEGDFGDRDMTKDLRESMAPYSGRGRTRTISRIKAESMIASQRIEITRGLRQRLDSAQGKKLNDFIISLDQLTKSIDGLSGDHASLKSDLKEFRDQFESA